MKKLVFVAAGLLVLASSANVFAGGYVRLYEDKGFSGHSVNVGFRKSISDLHAVGLNDVVSSVKYSVPAGWEAVLYKNSGYSKSPYVLQGSGSIPDLGSMNDEASSIEWRRR